MRRILTLLTCALLSFTFMHAQVLFQEDFEGGTMSAEWTITTNATDGGWLVGSVGALSSQSFPIAANGSSFVAGTNDDGCNCDKNNEYLITPAIDLSGQTAVAVSFDAYYTDSNYQGSQEDATIEVSIDGMNWDVVEDLHGHGSWDRHFIDLSDYVGESTVYIGFRYDDNGGWLYGFAIDNVVVEVPPALEATLVEVDGSIYGEVNRALPIKGTVYNAGIDAITALEISYTIDGGTAVTETLDNLDFPSFSFYNFETSTPWVPTSAGAYEVEVSIVSINGGADGNPDDNSGGFDTEVFVEVIVPNKIADFIIAEPIISEVANAGNSLNKPTDLDFFPILGKDELWVVNQRTENAGGSTLTIADATAGPSNMLMRVDGNAWHFMSLPTGIAFSDENFNFGTSPGVQDANHGGGTFTGPTLWSSDPDIYAQPSGGNGSHLDMLHGSPFSMGIAHEVDNVFWVYDDWNKDIVRYDFVDDHGPGNDDHSDAMIRRYSNIGITADTDIPSHMVLDKPSGWLYFVDNGNDRIVRLDINSATGSTNLAEINEPLAEHSSMLGFTYEVIIEAGLDRPSGIEIFENRLLVGDYATGDIIVYDMDNDFAELGRIATLEEGLTGIKIGPDGNLWYTNRLQNTLNTAEPGDPTSTTVLAQELPIVIHPNPSPGLVSIAWPRTEQVAQVWLNDALGRQLANLGAIQADRQLDLSYLANGVYFLNFQFETATVTKRIVIQK